MGSDAEAAYRDDQHWKDDPRWKLVERILATPDFKRSARLSDFLRYICLMTLEDRSDEINEQSLGEIIFGRPKGYDSSVDTIVRSHALRMRNRLDAYFARESAKENLRIEVPRGHYVPRFYDVNEETTVEVTPRPHAEAIREVTAPITLDTAADYLPPSKWSRLSGMQVYLWTFLAGIALGAMALMVFSSAGRMESKETELERTFWSALFPKDGRAIIVPGDSGLVMYETISGKEVNLTDYINGAYPQSDPNLSFNPAESKDMAANLGRRRYTSFVDLDLSSRLTQLPQWSPDHISIVYSRDLRAADVSRSNLILIGSREANPWVSLVEPSMNFVLTREASGEFYFRNRNPRNGELAEYRPVVNSGGLGATDLYGEVAYLPNPSGYGMVLVLSGLWMSGTQSAGNFVLNHEQFTSWLKSIVNPDGSIPPFELLISTKNLQGSSPYSLIIAKRVTTMPRYNAAR